MSHRRRVGDDRKRKNDKGMEEFKDNPFIDLTPRSGVSS